MAKLDYLNMVAVTNRIFNEGEAAHGLFLDRGREYSEGMMDRCWETQITLVTLYSNGDYT